MRRYAQGLTALKEALDLMIEEGDTLLVAAIAHPMHLMDTRILQKRTEATADQITPAVKTRQ
jgi:hypothetical protein